MAATVVASDEIVDSSNSQAAFGAKFTSKLILAPMVRINTLPFRLLCLDYGADLVYSEEIVDLKLLNCIRTVDDRLGTVNFVDRASGEAVLRIATRERANFILQIGTCDPANAVAVAKLVVNDVSGIDVNMGCPKAFSLKGGMGAALLTQPDKIAAILTDLVAAVDGRISISCKIRLLPDVRDTLRLIDVIAGAGVAALAVHGRRVSERPHDAVRIAEIANIVEYARTAHPSLAVIANGGSCNSRSAQPGDASHLHTFWRQTGASSLMIARTAEWNPSIFQQLQRQQQKQQSAHDVFDVIKAYLDLAIAYDAPHSPTKYAIQQMLGGLQQTTEVGQRLLHAVTMEQICAIFGKSAALQAAFDAHDHSTTTGVVSSQRQLYDDNSGHQMTTADAGVHTADVAYIRGIYCKSGRDMPKSRLHNYCIALLTKLGRRVDANLRSDAAPSYATTEIKTAKQFDSVVAVDVHESDGDGGRTVRRRRFASTRRHKSKRDAEQAAALVALHWLQTQSDHALLLHPPV